ncbi:MAG: ABC transporter substrate-binding protein [Rhodobacteraceae bacterium]|nr:ABC transporter substrate-binding protein [Paracoccaceae bacterium]
MTRIDRRALFTSGAAAALLMATGVSLSAAPVSGGRLRLAVAREDDGLMRVARGAVFDTLTEIAPDGALRGELATGWQGDAEAREWLFDLRDGVIFHDGTAFEAGHVVASLAAKGFKPEAVGRLQVRLELARGNPDLPYLLADPDLTISLDGRTNGMGDWVGTGLYRVGRVQEGRHFLGHRVARHYKDGLAGWAESIEIIVIPRADIRAEALRDGHVDVAALPLPDGLLGRGEFHYFPSVQDMALAARHGVGVPERIGELSALDDGRIAERWWMLRA